MDRRHFVVGAVATGGLAALGALRLAPSSSAQPGPFGALRPADIHGLRLPDGFTARVLATTGQQVPGTSFVWHPNPDGGATFTLDDGGWVYVSNDESSGFQGGVSMLRFDAAGDVVDARSILQGTNRNCAGGPTPWGTWLSCEEYERGEVWEVDPLGENAPVRHPGMGVFSHEAAAADVEAAAIYLTEDRPDSGLYRFRPDTWGDLSSGTLDILTADAGQLRWNEVPDPQAARAETRYQVADTVRFAGGEGAWFEDGLLYFTTKGDNRVWRFEPSSMTLDIIYDIATAAAPVLSGVDNIVMSATGELYICEDGGNMEIVVLTENGGAAPFLQLEQNGSELTGVAFDPSGTRMYFSSQRGPGRTYEVTGPFDRSVGSASGPESAPAAVTTTKTKPDGSHPEPAPLIRPAETGGAREVG